MANIFDLQLFLTGKKGYSVLQALVDNKFHRLVRMVCVGKDSNVVNDFSDEIQQLCEKNNIKFCFDPKLFEVPNESYVIAAGWQKIIHQVDEHKLIVFHDSLLPQYRGFAPLISALLNKDNEIGVTALTGAASYDCGSIYFSEKIEVSYPILVKDAIDLLCPLYGKLACKIVDAIIKGSLVSHNQDEEKASYSLWRDNDDYCIQWDQSAEQIRHFIQCVGYPYKGASTNYNGNLLRIFNAKVINDVLIANRTPGKIIFMHENKNPIVVCGSGLLQLLDYQYDSGDVCEKINFRTRFK